MTTSTFEANINTQPATSSSVFARVLAWFAKTNAQSKSTWADGARGM